MTETVYQQRVAALERSVDVGIRAEIEAEKEAILASFNPLARFAIRASWYALVSIGTIIAPAVAKAALRFLSRLTMAEVADLVLVFTAKDHAGR